MTTVHETVERVRRMHAKAPELGKAMAQHIFEEIFQGEQMQEHTEELMQFVEGESIWELLDPQDEDSVDQEIEIEEYYIDTLWDSTMANLAALIAENRKTSNRKQPTQRPTPADERSPDAQHSFQ